MAPPSKLSWLPVSFKCCKYIILYYGVKLKDRVSNKELKESLGIVDMLSVLQQNRCYNDMGMCTKGR